VSYVPRGPRRDGLRGPVICSPWIAQRGSIDSAASFLQILRSGRHARGGEVGGDTIDSSPEVGEIFGHEIAAVKPGQIVGLVAKRVDTGAAPRRLAGAPWPGTVPA
jgi:hypothetical protein